MPKRRRSQIRCGDKLGLERYRTYAEQFYDKRGLDGRMEDLIGGIELGDWLKQQGEIDRTEHEKKGREEVHWRRDGDSDKEMGIRDGK